MNISNILENLAKIERRVFAVAEHAITFVRQAYGHLPGDSQHAQAVEMLRKAFPSLARWVAHALVSIVFGWLEKTAPEKLAPQSNFMLDEAVEAAPEVMRASPFAPLPPNTTEPAPPDGLNTAGRGILSQILHPNAPTI